ncbi:hypothetical protein F4779DRAFT_629871 [Xylariaceae sp. FL0662B]|nr:hypothetical protein F4779DRAFT_629871 [Xylariaceae sp. FL0662B]
MENGTSASGTPRVSSFPSRVASMSKRLMDRGQAEDWAWKDMKFLVYDDHDVRLNGYDSDDEEGLLKFALKMSTEATEPDNTEVSGNHTSQRSTCAACPDFPHRWKTRKLRLFKPSDAFRARLNNPKNSTVSLICGHYVAISYCWPIPEVDASGNTIEPERIYKVRELDGNLRTSRALDDVLDRAIDAAKYFGLCMIWIDQECLPQPKEDSSEEQKNEQQLSIQAMDIVYNRAMVTVGLHDGVITNQAQMQAINVLRQADKAQRIPIADVGFLNYTLDFLEMVSRDRWYTRAWVVQEALSASNGLVIAFRRGSGISCPFSYNFVREPGYSVDRQSRQLQSESVYITADGFRGIVRVAKQLLERQYTPFGHALMRLGGRPTTLLERAGPIIRAAEALNSVSEAPRGPGKNFFWIGGAYSYGFRYTVDIAGVLTLLRIRSCRNQEDRIAIVVNMCNYDLRLDTQAAIDNDMFRAGFMALALRNGDLSLLVPEAYSDYMARSFEQSRPSLWPPENYPDLIDHVTIRNLQPVKVNSVTSLTDQGIVMSACLWNVEDQLDLSPITWQIDRRENKTVVEFEERRRRISAHFSKETVMRQTMDELDSKTTPLPADSPVWGPIRSEGVQVRQHVSAHRVEQVPQMQHMVCEILFGILRYLMNYAETDPRAAGLASSIWQSVRVDMVEDRMDLPDEVNQALFDHPDVIANPFKTLQLDVMPGGTYSELWFIDQIMQCGTLWVGRYIPIGPEFMSRMRWMRRDDTSPSPEAQDVEGSATATYKEKQPANVTKGKRKRNEPEPILKKQLAQQMLASMANIAMPRDHDLGLWGSAMITGLAVFAGSGLFSDEAEDHRARNRISTFDVEGPCLVATPWNSQWERLPHPDFRSMSFWIK